MKQNKMMDLTFSYEGQEIPYQIIQTNRKTIAITVDKEAKVVVRAPLCLSKKKINQIIDENQAQIYRVYLRTKEKNTVKAIISMKDVTRVPFYGMEFQVYYNQTSGRERIEDDGKRLEIFVNTNECEVYERAGRLLESWYRKKGKEVFTKKVEEYATMMNTTYQKVTIKDQKTRWGSCSNHKNLNFNWRLLMMPKEVLDYVVVHELAHTLEMNHSRDFWSHVEVIIPNYKKYRKFLKEETRKYRIE